MELQVMKDKLFGDLRQALKDRVELKIGNSGLSFRSFAYLLDIDRGELVKGQSWNQRVILKAFPQDFTEDEKQLLEEKVIFIYLYGEDQELIPVLSSNFVHINYKPNYTDVDYQNAFTSILKAIPNDTVSFTGNYRVSSPEFQAGLLRWMSIEEVQFGSRTGRTLMQKLYPHSELLNL